MAEDDPYPNRTVEVVRTIRLGRHVWIGHDSQSTYHSHFSSLRSSSIDDTVWNSCRSINFVRAGPRRFGEMSVAEDAMGVIVPTGRLCRVNMYGSPRARSSIIEVGFWRSSPTEITFMVSMLWLLSTYIYFGLSDTSVGRIGDELWRHHRTGSSVYGTMVALTGSAVPARPLSPEQDRLRTRSLLSAILRMRPTT